MLSIIQEYRNHLEEIFENSFNYIYLHDKKGNILDVNSFVVKNLGYSKNEILNMKVTDFLLEDVSSQVSEEIKKTIETEVMNKPKAYKVKKKDGSFVYVEINAIPLKTNGKIHAILSIGNDITKYIKVEQKLKESEEKFRVLTEQSFMSIMVIQDGVLKYFNERLPKRLGYSAEEIKNWKPYEFAKVIHPDFRDFVLKQAKKKQDGEEDAINNYIYRSRTKDGKSRWVENFSKTINYGGRPADLVTSIDITEKKEAEELIIEENKRLLELDELRRDLITRLSHELKTPLTAIYGAVQIILKVYSKELREEILEYVEIGNRGCLRLKDLVENLLDVSMLDTKKFKLELQKENLVDLINECVEDMKYLRTNRQLTIDLDLPTEIYLDVDKLKFRQVLINIISNAIKNTPKEGKIIINLIEKVDYVDIQIKDTGVGFTVKEKEKLFKKFGKIERYGMHLDVDIEGSGLGLFISKEIVELHAGQIFVESEGRNKGSTFTIRLFKK